MTDTPIFLTVPEAMQTLRIGRTFFYELIAAGKLQRVKIGKKALIPVASIESFAASLVEAAG